MSDYIKRSDALKIVNRCKDRLVGKGSTYEIMLSMFEDEHFAPTADVVRRKRGEWTQLTEGVGLHKECGFIGHTDDNYCGGCGADMRGDDNESD